MDQQASYLEQQDLETAEKLQKTSMQGEDSSFTSWVASVPQQPEMTHSADLL